MEPKVIEWDGVHLPEGLRNLPAGQYAIEPLFAPLTEEEESGIAEGLNELDAGGGIPLADVLQEIRSSAKKR
jgi:hypothetical protein